MPADDSADPWTALMQSDFDPRSYGPVPSAEHRLAIAAEYAAFQLGQINRTLARILERMEKESS